VGSGDRAARRPPLRGGTHVSELRFHGPEKCRALSVVRRALGRRPPGTGSKAGAGRSSGVGHPRRRPPRRRVREVPQPGGTRTHEGRGRVNGLVNGLGRTNGLVNGVGRVNGLVTPTGRVNGLMGEQGRVNGTISGTRSVRAGRKEIRLSVPTKRVRYAAIAAATLFA